ncbi:MAG: branched-chain amino acid ABC transporter permease [Rhodospirillaceae bacterium]|jgi:branched-chain amino acid transport system permease protein|nr:branched-chain amino acid ABC transporter permease [Rhodospirillaceae bacterium]MBT5941118.1 branched-chain amino acid ABC transporter permease [Rhodospirillaceae bacterium]
MTDTSYKVIRSTRASRIGSIIGLILFAILVSYPSWGDRATMRLLVEMFYILALAQMWNLLAGYGGLVSVGQQAFVGLGGYMLFLITIHFGVGPIWTVPLAGLIGALISLPVAFLVFRLRGHYFAIGTWVVAEVFLLLFAQVKSLGGGSGMSLPVSVIKSISSSRAGRDSAIYWTALLVVIVVIGIVYFLLRSRHGLALTAIRDSEEASGSLGVDNFRAKLLVYIFAAFGTAAIGALIFLTKLRISPSAAFDINWTTTVIFIVVIGGIGTIEGPILGTIVYFLLREQLADFGSWYLILLGATAVVVMLKAPQGIWGIITHKYDLRFFPVQRRLLLKENDSQES